MKTNRAAVKSLALEASKMLRAGKFTRVGEKFYESVETDLDNAVRQICGAMPDRMPIVDGISFVHWSEIEPRLKEKVNALVASIVVRKILHHPSIGCTLQEP